MSAARLDPPTIEGVRRRFVNARGIDFHVTEAGPEDGVPVLCLHGWPQHHYEFRDLLAEPPAGLRIIAVDLPGYGWSGPPPHRWEKDEVASDVLALLDTLGLRQVVLAAHDWGGFVGYLMAVRAPERMSAFLPLNIAHRWNPVSVLLPHMWRFWYQPVIGFFGVPIQQYTPFVAFGLWNHLYDKRTMTWDEIRVYSDRFRDPVCAQAGSDTYRTFVTKEIPAMRRTPETRRLHVPTRALFGIYDRAIHTSLVSPRHVDADDYRVELVPDCGHFIVDEQPALVRARVAALAAEFPPASA